VGVWSARARAVWLGLSGAVRFVVGGTSGRCDLTVLHMPVEAVGKPCPNVCGLRPTTLTMRHMYQLDQGVQRVYHHICVW
jgi:hypothetical protein